MRTTIQFRSTPVGDAVFNASRQVWLASLGAAVVTRDWAQTEAGDVMRTLVKEGTAVESKAIRMVGNRVEGSLLKANSVWRQARATVEATVRQAADTAVTFMQSSLPRSLPKVKLPSMLTPSVHVRAKRAVAKPATKAKRAAKTRATKTVKRAKRAVKAATKK
jgi:hypothetical protein